MNDKNIFPETSQRLQKAHWGHLIYQGLYLHYASLWGPLRASKSFRVQNTQWLQIVFTRWIKEYGLNLTLFIIGLFAITIYFAHTWFIAFIGLVILLPLLTIMQMFVDNYRTDSRVYFDSLTSSGLTVKTYTNDEGETVWSFYNHFALPIGQKKGKSIREALHAEAQLKRSVLICQAQNAEIANYYLHERINGKNYGGPRPLIVWNYSQNTTESNHFKHEKSTFISQLFGISSIRNSGQIPLNKKSKKIQKFLTYQHLALFA